MESDKFETDRQNIIKAQEEELKKQDWLAFQDLKNFKIEEIHPLHPDIISRQATLNIGTIGHVAHGKSTLVHAISGVNVSRTLGSNTICRPSNTRKRRSVTSPSSWVMRIPSCTSVLSASHLSASSPTSLAKRTSRNASTAKQTWC